MVEITNIGKIFKSYPIDSILILPNSPYFTIADINNSCLQNTQSKETDWIGKNILEAFPVNPKQPYLDDKTALKISLETVLKTKQCHKINNQRYLIPNTETGVPDERFAVIENIPILNEKNEVEYILQTIVDFTENKYLVELENLEREILEMNASGKRNIKEVFKSYLFGIEQLHPGMICSILQVTNNRVYDLASPSLPHEYLEMISGLEIGENEGSCGTAAHLKETVIVSDIDTDFRWLKYREIAQQFKLKACWSTPIIDSHGNVIATFANYYREHKSPNEREEITIKRAGHLIQIILEGYLKNKQIKESEKKFRSLVINMDVGVLLQGPKAEIILSNPKALELLGINEDQLFGKTSFDSDWNVIHEDGSDFPGNMHPVPQSIVTKKAINNVVMGVYRPKTKDRVWLLVDAEPELNDEGNIVNVVCTFIDITERKLAEEEIKISKKTYRGVLNSISELIYIQDENGCFIDVNEAVVAKYGYPKEYFIGKTPEFLSAPDKNNFERIIEAIAKAWQGSKENFEFWGITKDGMVFPKEVNLSIGTYFGKQAIIAVGRDISENKAFEDKLTNTNSILNATIESTNNGILVVNSEGAIIKRNEKFSELWQIPKDVLSTNDDTKLLTFILNKLIKPDEFLAKVNDLYAKPFSESIDEIYFKDGRIFERISKPMYINGDPKGRVWSFEDITNRKQTENELIKNNLRLSGIIKGTQSGTWEWNVQTGEAIFNDRWAEIIGYTLEELKPISIHTWIEHVNKEDLKISDQILQRHFSRELDYYEFEMRMKHKNGSWVWILDRGKVISWTDDGKPLLMLGTHQDITERKKIEHDLIHSKLQYDKLVSRIPIGIFIIRSKINGDFKFDFISPPVVEMLNMDLATAYSDPMRAFSMVHQNDFEDFIKLNQTSLTQKTPFDWTGRMMVDKKIKWINISSIPELQENGDTLWHGTMMDITENKNAIDELNKSEKKYRQLIESTNEGIVVAQGSYLKFVNTVVLKLMGRTEDELTKVPFLDYVHKEDRMLVRRNYLKRITEDNAISKFQFRIIAKNQSIRWIEMGGIVINWNGQPAALNFMKDITENFEYIKAIEDQKQKLSDIAWTQSHMVRAPLARMMGLINLLQYENNLDENTRQLLKHILDSAHEFDTIIKSIVQNTQQKSQ